MTQHNNPITNIINDVEQRQTKIATMIATMNEMVCDIGECMNALPHDDARRADLSRALSTAQSTVNYLKWVTMD